MFSYASENEMTESLPAVGRHYDQVGAMSFCCLKNLDTRIAHHDFDLVAGFAVDFLACQPLKLGSCGHLHLTEGQSHLRSGRHRHYVKQMESCFAFLRQLGRELKRQE